MSEGGLPLPPAFQYLIACDLNLVIISLLALKWKVFNVGMTDFHLFYEMKLKTSKCLGILKPVYHDQT